jgi:hypothetical protein
MRTTLNRLAAIFPSNFVHKTKKTEYVKKKKLQIKEFSNDTKIYLNKSTKLSSSGVCSPVAVPSGMHFGLNRSTIKTVRVDLSDKLNAQ